MKRTSGTNSRSARKVDWSSALPSKYAAALADKRWRVKLDSELVDLLSSEGNPAARLLGLARRRRGKRERTVLVVPMSEREYAAVRPLLLRIGAKVERVPPHPNWDIANMSRPRRRKAG